MILQELFQPFVPLWFLLPLLTFGALFYWFFVRFTAGNVKIKPMRASSFKPELVPSKLDTIVIGSGSGGCACANLLAQAGQRVLLLEQHERTGGCTHSFREHGAEFDTGLHYTSAGMASKTQRPGALLNFMTKGKQHWTMLTDPYDQVLFPHDNNVKNGLPNASIYDFVTGAENTVDSVLSSIDPDNTQFKQRMMLWMDLCCLINDGFTALGISRLLPKPLHFLVQKRIDCLMKLASYTVRDVQHAVFNLGYTTEDLLNRGCPTAPAGPEPDPVLRRIKAVLTHPIGDYAVQPRDATFAAHGITMAHYMAGAAYTVGATQNISIRSSSLLREMGGEVLTDATVRKILIENGRAVGVQVSNTTALAEATDPHAVPVTEIRAKNVVCATSIYNLYEKLLPQDHPVVRDFHDPQKRTVRQSNGHIFLFCKIAGDAADLDLPEHNLWYFNGYDLDEAFDKYFANPVEERPPTVYIGFPCTKVRSDYFDSI
jgi:all-trans-retinol 13,14-reductase